MKSALVYLFLVTCCWALPFEQTGFLDFMMEDEGGSGLVPVTKKPPIFTSIPGPDGPVCPFRCQCHLRVVQCSDLGKKAKPQGEGVSVLHNQVIPENENNCCRKFRLLQF